MDALSNKADSDGNRRLLGVDRLPYIKIVAQRERSDLREQQLGKWEAGSEFSAKHVIR